MNTVLAPGCLLIVEDEMHLAMMLEDILVDAGYRVLKASRVPTALALATAEPIDGAILDINLAGVQVFPVAQALRERDIPFLFTSGYGEDGLPDDYHGCPMLQKPYVVAQLKQAVRTLLRG
ncbi:response regulator [Lysobacter sp. A286]